MKKSLIIYIITISIAIAILTIIVTIRNKVIRIDILENTISSNDTSTETQIEENYLNNTEEKVAIEILKNSVTPSGVTMILIDKNEEKYYWKNDYKVQKLENEKWDYVELVEDGTFLFDMTDCVFNENGQFKQSINWNDMYGNLSQGVYRIEKTISKIGEIKRIYSNEFEIK